MNPRDLYTVPKWASPAVDLVCECGRRALARVSIAVLADGEGNGDLTASGKIWRTRARRESMALCPACLCIERYYRGELTYRQACEAEEALRKETGKPAVRVKTYRGGHKAAERRVERLSCKARSLTAATVATKAIPKHRAALALLLAEAEGLLTIVAGKGGAVFQT
jgi:hypothetical protein